MPPSEARSVVDRRAHELEVVGVHEHGDALALDDPAQRAAHGLEHELGVDGDEAPA